MKKFRYMMIILFSFMMFIFNVKADVTLDANTDITNDQVKSWAKAMADTDKYHAVCAYNYQNGDTYYKYVVLFGKYKAGDEDNSSNQSLLKVVPIAAKGTSEYHFCGSNKASTFRIDSNMSSNGYSTVNPCAAAYFTYKEFIKGCPKINFEKDDLYTSWGKKYYKMTIASNSKNPVFKNSNTSPIYTYVENIDSTKQQVCNYGPVSLTYSASTGKVTYTADRETINSKFTELKINGSYSSVRNEVTKKHFTTDSNGNIKCPNIECTLCTDNSGMTNDLCIKYLSPTATKSKFDVCTLKSAGVTKDDQTAVDKDDYFDINNGTITFPSFNFGELGQSCEEFLGASGVKLIRTARRIIQIGSTILTLVLGMIMFIPAIMNKDNAALSKALSKFVKLLIVLAIILLLPTFVKVIGMIAGFDITCI